MSGELTNYKLIKIKQWDQFADGIFIYHYLKYLQNMYVYLNYIR